MYTPKTYLIPRSDNKVLIISPLQQIVNADANSRQQKVISTAGSLQQTVFTNAGSQQESCFPMSDNRKVVSVPETHDIDSVSDYVKNFVSYNPQTDFADSSSPELNNVSQDNELPPPLILHEGEPNKHQIKHIITEINGHFPKKLTPIPKGSVLE